MKTILLADNQDITRTGIFYLCQKMPDIARIEEVTNRKDLLSALTVCPEAVVILDYTLFDLISTDDLLILQSRFKKARWILFSEELSEDFIRRLIFSSEAFSIVMKDASLDEIQTSLHCALRGERFICYRITNLLFNRKRELEPKERLTLTITEREILKSIALGKSTKEIAAERFSSIHTITTHRKNIFRKLEVNNVHEATKYALRAGIIDAAEYYI